MSRDVQQLELLAPTPAAPEVPPVAPRARELERAAHPRVGESDRATSAAAAERVRSEGIGSRQARAVLRAVVINPGKTPTELGRLTPKGVLGTDSVARRFTIARRMSGLRELGFLQQVASKKSRECLLFPTAKGLEEVKSWKE